MLRLYGKALHKVDAGWLNAFGWSKSGSGATSTSTSGGPRASELDLVSVGGSSADEIDSCSRPCNERAKPGEIAAIELNAGCHNVNFPFETILEDASVRAVPRSRHPVILKVSPDEDYRWQAGLAEDPRLRGDHCDQHREGVAARPETGEPYLRTATARSRGGRSSHRAAGRRGAARCGIRLPIIANGGIRDFDDCREYVWAGADAVKPGLGGLAPADAAVRARAPRGAAHPPADLRMERSVPPAAAPHWRPTTGQLTPPPREPRRAAALRAVPAALPRVAIVTTGGTIDSLGVDRLDLAGVPRNGASASPPASSSRAIAPELASFARAPRSRSVPSGARPHRRRPRRPRGRRPWGLLERDEADGVVVTHGTNTLEETAWLLHLVVGRRPAVVVHRGDATRLRALGLTGR